MTLRRAGKVCALNTSSLPASTKVQPAGRQQYARYNGYEKVAWTCSGPDLMLAARSLGCQGCLVLVEPLCPQLRARHSRIYLLELNPSPTCGVLICFETSPKGPCRLG